MTYTERLEAYNQALRTAEEEERQRANGAWTSAAKRKAPIGWIFEDIKERAEREIAAASAFIDGLAEEPKTLYIQFPEAFDGDVSSLDDCYGELPEAVLAWIENAREIIRKYHELVYGAGEAKAGAA